MESTSTHTPADATPLELDGSAPAAWQVEQVARFGRQVRLADSARERVGASHAALLRTIDDGARIYGVNTGFGSAADQVVDREGLEQLQQNLLRSHAAGMGEPLPGDVVRAMLLLLAGSLARGCSGVRVELVERVIGLLNAGVTPVVPEIGSVGASGDLAPLAHCALVLMGEGRAVVDGREMPGAQALEHAGLEPIAPVLKEGLALINGTHLMTARAALIATGLRRAFDAALASAALSMDAMRATDSFLDPRVHAVRTQTGQARVAARLWDLIRGSGILQSHRSDEDRRVQDPYSLRCTPQVLGAALDLIDSAAAIIDRELAAVSDNPLIFSRDHGADGPAAEVISAGNFHGAPIAMALDTLSIAMSHIAGIAERRLYLLSSADPKFLSLSGEEPPVVLPHLSPRPGIQSGYMIVQYAAAACANELATLATPASVYNVPTCAGMEDYNSFGPRSAAKAARGLELVRHVIAAELLCSSEALEALHRSGLRSSDEIERIHALVREHVPALREDRSPAPDLATLTRLIEAGRVY